MVPSMRWWKQWQISRCLDDGAPLPERLRRQVENDPALKRFYRRGLRLESRLSADVVDLQWEESLEKDRTEHRDPVWHRKASTGGEKKKPRKGMAFSVAMYAATVTLCLFMADYYWRHRPMPPQASVPKISVQETIAKKPRLKADEMVEYLQVATPPLKETMQKGMLAVQEEIMVDVKEPVVAEWEDLRADFDLVTEKSKLLLAEFRPSKRSDTSGNDALRP